ncbi:aryl-sulfate sulfotransferase [Companilactobacillus halodurans]|uniref:Aryl-sulfate sulfotransferase n=1 Tax=Companilactobacillus halodurans TaxID=2584183 RepID=A0A5P1A010_9LACO|nr:aryl-sulfate sulfotransferase [Companilactobacillus halodurans]MQS98610.1 aryl-sulfate sulfotransferase [Companilactobacillus halodurans]
MKKYLGIGVILSLFIVILVGCSGQSKSQNVPLSTAQIKKNIGSKLISTREDSQKKLTKKYQEETKKDSNTLDNPYVKVNPYKDSPLTALMIFKTDSAAKVSYVVQGKTNNTDVSNNVKGYKKTHQVPIMGLYADETNTVTVTVEYKNGTTETKTLKIKTGALPKYVKAAKVSVSKNDKSKMDIGTNKLTLINRTTKEPFAIDADGAVRWYSTDYSQHTIEQTDDGHLLILTKKNVDSSVYNDLIETDPMGRVYKEYSFNSKVKSNDSGNSKDETTVIHHDLLELPNKDILATVNDGSKYKEDVMVQISHKTGKIVKVIDLKRILPKSMYENYKAGSDKKVDWFHQNAVDYDKTDNTIMISGRNQDMIMKLNYKTNKIIWIYSGKSKSSWPKKYRSKILTPTKGTTITGGQHGLYQLNKTADGENIILYDNNIDVTNGDKKTSGKYSQAVQYHVNEKKMTIDQKWSYGKNLGKANFTNIIGYAERESNGNTLIDFGYKDKGKESNIIEVDPEGNQVFNVTIKNASTKAYVYRAYLDLSQILGHELYS